MPRYQVSIWASNVPFHNYGWINSIFGGRSDCFAALYDGTDGQELGRTETIRSTKTPNWTKILFIEADPANIVTLNVKIFHDMKIKNSSVKSMMMSPLTMMMGNTEPESIQLAEASFEATEVNRARGHTETKPTEQEQTTSDCTISISVIESNPETTGKVRLQLRALDIRNVEPGLLDLGRTDPYFEISKKIFQPTTGYTKYQVVYRSAVIENHLNPLWKPFEVGLEELCNGQLDSTELCIAVYDTKQMIGCFAATLKQLQQQISIRGNADRERAFELKKDLGGNKDDETFGLICVLVCEIILE